MEQQDLIAIVGLVIFGLVFGALTARSSEKREAIQSRGAAQVFHYLACALWATVTPTVLVSVLVLELGLLPALGIAFSMVGVAYIMLILFAMLEQPALVRIQQQEDSGWTEADARSSGL